MQLVPDAHFNLEAGKDELSVYQFATKQWKHYFCRSCGIHTFTVAVRRHLVNLGCVESLDSYALEPVIFDGKELL